MRSNAGIFILRRPLGIKLTQLIWTLSKRRNQTTESLKSDGNKHVSSLWFIDSGASSHMTFDICHFIKFSSIQPDYVEVGEKSNVLAVGQGTVIVSIIVNGKHRKCLLSNVSHVPDLACNLLSVSTMDAKGIKTMLLKGQCSMIKNNCVIAQGYRLGGLYALCIAPNDN